MFSTILPRDKITIYVSFNQNKLNKLVFAIRFTFLDGNYTTSLNLAPFMHPLQRRIPTHEHAHF